MIIPGDLLPWVCPHLLMSGLVSRLHEAGMVTSDVPLPSHAEDCQCHSSTSATFLGICYVPGMPQKSLVLSYLFLVTNCVQRALHR
jgi:hypothetical protein